jgi:general secretion pathway protein D
VQALLTDSNNHVMQRPQLRVTDGGKASLKVGEKIPYVSGSLNSAVATPGSIPYATTQFQQVDVGTNIDFQTVHVSGESDVSMHVKVEISNVLNEITIAGIQEPEIGQQVDEADIRMKDGEVSILGGLSDKELQTSYSGLPGFTNLPLLGYLFGTKGNTKTDNQVLIALIPHVIRAPDMTHVGDRGVFAGTEHVTRVERKPEGTNTPAIPQMPNTVPLPASTPLTPLPATRPVVPGTKPPETATPHAAITNPATAATPAVTTSPTASPPRIEPMQQPRTTSPPSSQTPDKP